MNRREREIQNRQPARIPGVSRSDSVLVLALVAALFVGITLGGLVFAPQPRPQPTRTAMNEATSTMAFFLKGAPTRQQ
jgi:hypothetical protein